MNGEKKNGSWLGAGIILFFVWAVLSRWFGTAPAAMTHSVGDAEMQRQEAISKALGEYQRVRDFMPQR